MDIKQLDTLLRDMPRLAAEIRDIEIIIKDIKADITVSPITYSQGGGKGNKFNSETENKALELLGKLERLEAKKRKTEYLLERLKNAINSLEAHEKELIEMRYIKNMKYWQISETDQRCEKQIGTTIKNILKKINEILGNR